MSIPSVILVSLGSCMLPWREGVAGTDLARVKVPVNENYRELSDAARRDGLKEPASRPSTHACGLGFRFAVDARVCLR